jgi:Flp pilus assembly protein TadG
VARNSNKKRAKSGQSLVEFALLLPVLLIAMLGALNLGLGIRAQLQLAQVSQQAAQFLVHHPAYGDPDLPLTNPPTYSRLVAYMNSLSTYQLSPLEVSLSPKTSLVQTGSYTATVQQDTVQVSYPFSLIIPMVGKLSVGLLNSGSINLGATASTIAATHSVPSGSVCGSSVPCSPPLVPSYEHKITWTVPSEAYSLDKPLPLWYCIERTFQDQGNPPNVPPFFHDDVIFNAPTYPAMNSQNCIAGTPTGTNQMYFIDPTDYTAAGINPANGLFYFISAIQRNGLQSAPPVLQVPAQ